MSAPAERASMKFFVPDVGTMVRLKEDWTFRLYVESRNRALVDYLGIPVTRSIYGRNIDSKEVVFKAWTTLKVDRVYIRKGVKDYSSLTFHIQKGKHGGAEFDGESYSFAKKGFRFWAKLSDVNKMVVEVDQATLAEN